MKMLDRYIGSSFLKATAFSLLAFTFIWLLFDAQPLLGLETQSSQQRHLYWTLLFRIPRLVSMVLPAAVMFGVCFTVAQFTVSRELVAVFSAGTSFYRAISPILISCIFFAVFLFLLNDFVVSPANILANKHEESLKRGTSHSIERDLLYQANLRGKEGYYFIYFYDKKNREVIGGVNYIKISRDARPLVMYQAESMKYLPEQKKWKLKLAQTIRFGEGEITEVTTKPELILRLPETPEFFENPNPDPSELNVFETLREIQKRSEYGFSTRAFELHLHHGIAFPFMVLVLGVIGSIAGNMGNLRGGSPLVRALLVSILSLFIYYAVFSLFETLGKQGLVSPVLSAWIPTLFFLGAAAVAIWRYRR